MAAFLVPLMVTAKIDRSALWVVGDLKRRILT